MSGLPTKKVGEWVLEADTKRDSRTGLVLHVDMRARLNGFIRYTASFRSKRGSVKRELDYPFNKQAFSESGGMALFNNDVKIPPFLYRPMSSWAAAIIFSEKQSTAPT